MAEGTSLHPTRYRPWNKAGRVYRGCGQWLLLPRGERQGHSSGHVSLGNDYSSRGLSTCSCCSECCVRSNPCDPHSLVRQVLLLSPFYFIFSNYFF